MLTDQVEKRIEQGRFRLAMPRLAIILCAYGLLAFSGPFGSVDRAMGQDELVRFERLGAAEGLRQYRRGRWGIVGVNVSNDSTESAEVMASFGFDSDATLRYARKMWVPAKSVRRTWAPIRIPDQTADQESQDLYGQLIDSASGVEKVKSRAMEREQHVSRLRLVDEPFVTGVISSFEDAQYGSDVDPRYESVIAARAAASMGRRVALIEGRYLPSTPEAYDALDELVIYNDRFAEDPVACTAIRSWLNDGGQIWLQLDRIKIESAAKLLGERFRCEVVDRVELNTIDIETVNKRPGIRYTGQRDFELSVPMVRVAVEDVDVTHEMEGWPAAFSMPFGRGRVVVTTLGGLGWLVQSQAQERDVSSYGRFDACVELASLPIIESRAPTPASHQVFSNYLSERIGYEIVGRSTVVATLGLFCFFLLTVGLIQIRVGKLERMAWIAPLSAIVASLPMIWLGARSKSSIPPTLAMGQFVEIGDSSSFATVTGSMAVYQPEPATLTFGASQGGVFEPDFQGLEGTVRRMVWTDLDQWKWERVRLTGGVRTAKLRQNLLLSSPVEARGTFGERGFVGRLSGDLKLSDALLATPGRPALGVRMQDETFESASSDEMADGQFVDGAILTDEQRRRQDVYQALFANASRDSSFPSRRLLLGWSEPFDLGFEFSEELRTIGGAIVATPLFIDPPESGSRMTIPSPFVYLQTVDGPAGEAGGSSLYDSRTGKWIGGKSATNAWFHCRPPREVLPAQIQKVVVRMKATIPSRTLTIAGFKANRVEPVLVRENVIVPFEVAIDDPELVRLDERGGFPLGILISDESKPDELSEGVKWSIDYLQLEIHATAE